MSPQSPKRRQWEFANAREQRPRRWQALMRVAMLLTLFAPAQAAEPASIRDVSASEAQALLSSRPAMVLLDIRTPEEFAAGHLRRAINIDFLADDFLVRLNALDKNVDYLVYCRSGRRSARALAAFEALQFQSIYHLAGGLRQWRRDGRPTSPGVDQP